MEDILIKLTKVSENTLHLWQEGFNLKNEKSEVVLTYGTTIPGGMPYIFVKSGPNKGNRFEVLLSEMDRVCKNLLEE